MYNLSISDNLDNVQRTYAHTHMNNEHQKITQIQRNLIVKYCFIFFIATFVWFLRITNSSQFMRRWIGKEAFENKFFIIVLVISGIWIIQAILMINTMKLPRFDDQINESEFWFCVFFSSFFSIKSVQFAVHCEQYVT